MYIHVIMYLHVCNYESFHRLFVTRLWSAVNWYFRLLGTLIVAAAAAAV